MDQCLSNDRLVIMSVDLEPSPGVPKRVNSSPNRSEQTHGVYTATVNSRLEKDIEQTRIALRLAVGKLSDFQCRPISTFDESGMAHAEFDQFKRDESTHWMYLYDKRNLALKACTDAQEKYQKYQQCKP